MSIAAIFFIIKFVIVISIIVVITYFKFIIVLKVTIAITMLIILKAININFKVMVLFQFVVVHCRSIVVSEIIEFILTDVKEVIEALNLI